MRCDRIAHPRHNAHLTTSHIAHLPHRGQLPYTLLRTWRYPGIAPACSDKSSSSISIGISETSHQSELQVNPSQVYLGCALHSQLPTLIMATTVLCHVSLRSSVSSVVSPHCNYSDRPPESNQLTKTLSCSNSHSNFT